MDKLVQVAGYVPKVWKDELGEMRSAHRRLSESALIYEALEIAMPELRLRHPLFKRPVQLAHGKRKSAG